MSDSELEWLQQDLSQLMARDGPGAKTHSLFEVTPPFFGYLGGGPATHPVVLDYDSGVLVLVPIL